MSNRFFVDTLISGDRATLRNQEAHHLAHVMRAKVGDEVILFDGSGDEFSARIENVRKALVELTVFDRHRVDRETSIKLTLAVALPKGERQRWLIEKAVELGVARLVPLATQRGVAEPSLAAIERLRRAVIEASKQCGRNRLMEIGDPQSWQQFVVTPANGVFRMLAHPEGESLQTVRRATGNSDSLFAAVGPEGGFSSEEVALALAAGWTAIGLGPRVLRVETAALMIASWALIAS